ncbi:MAG TPA: HAD-IIIC family phosphatase [Elusimicrobiota bacterium]|nr:HAD-IIIC family phosphatase [Elusimicrobiota bacterium]
MSALTEAKALAAEGKKVEAARRLRDGLSSRMSYLDQTSAAKLADSLSEGLPPVRLAVLGSSTTAQLLPLLRLHAFKEGFRLELYDAPYDAYQQEILDEKSGLYAFKPQAALLYVNHRDARPGPAEAEAERWAALWTRLRERAGCAVLTNNFDVPVERAWGNLDAARTDAGLGRLRRLNALLAEKAGAGVAVIDVEHLSALHGKESWHDPRFWHHSRQAMSFDGLARYAAEAAAVLAAALGRSRKCLVLDLDNTLWGGVVGDDGAEGLELAGSPNGEAHLEFQRYVKELGRRGVLLAVCSKNEDERAREPFKKRPDMVLKLEDFSAFVANWEDKATNLRSIAAQLNIGLDALVFVDDNAGERELVRRFCPEVAVVDLPEDPAGFSRALDARRFFETVSVSKEDARRAAHFQAEAARESLRRGAPDLASFLKDLEMSAEAGPFTEPDVARIAQLINKTNQFNLTTRRSSEPEVRALMADPAAWTLAVRLRDRLGDYGLISAVIARRSGSAFEIDTWLMSCRVLGRGVEKLAFNRLLAAARAAGAKELVGRYLPTAKNAPVKELLPSLGFAAAPDGAWRLSVAGAKPQEVSIRDESPRAA